MKVLAVDTATRVAGAAVVDESGILAESWLNTGKTHSQKFLPMLDALLKNAGLLLEEIDCYAVTIGPGSFTGLRIGISTVKGFTQVTGKPAVSVVTLDALARNLCRVEGLVCPILDARRNEVYTSLYRCSGGVPERISPYRAVDPQRLAQELLPGSEKIFFLGDAAENYREMLESTLGEKASFGSLMQNLLRPSEVALIGLEKFKQGDPSDIKPLYLRLSEAEVKWNQAHGGCCS